MAARWRAHGRPSPSDRNRDRWAVRGNHPATVGQRGGIRTGRSAAHCLVAGQGRVEGLATGMLIDYEAVVNALEEHFLSEHSHGQRRLLQKLAELRVEHRIHDEGLPQKALRLYGAELFAQDNGGHPPAEAPEVERPESVVAEPAKIE